MQSRAREFQAGAVAPSAGGNIGKDVWIGYDAIIETSYPHIRSPYDHGAGQPRQTHRTDWYPASP